MRRRLVIGHILWRRVPSKFLSAEKAYRRRFAGRPVVGKKRRAADGERNESQRKRSKRTCDGKNGEKREPKEKERKESRRRAENGGPRRGDQEIGILEETPENDEGVERRVAGLFKGEKHGNAIKGNMRSPLRPVRGEDGTADDGGAASERVKSVSIDGANEMAGYSKHGNVSNDGGKTKGASEGCDIAWSGALHNSCGKDKKGRRAAENTDVQPSLEKQGLKCPVTSDPDSSGDFVEKMGHKCGGTNNLDDELDAIFARGPKKPKKQRDKPGSTVGPGNQDIRIAGSKDDLFGNAQEDRARRRTEEGFRVFREDELGLGKSGGDTPLCPFDCDCCF